MAGLDPQVKKLLRQQISWERFTGQDVYADERYDNPRQLACRIEADTVAVRSGDTVTYMPAQRVYFAHDDRHAQQIGLRDRFTGPGQAGGETVQPKTIETKYGPDGAPWLIMVTL